MIVGQDAVVDHLIVALLTQGHALLVGVPGLAKTLLVSSLSKALDLSFGRVQFTPDLLPADITGTDVMSEQAGRRELSFLPGPIFKNLVLADEINRTPPKTQAALLNTSPTLPGVIVSTKPVRYTSRLSIRGIPTMPRRAR